MPMLLTLRERALMEQLSAGDPLPIDAPSFIAALSLHGAGLVAFRADLCPAETWVVITEKGIELMRGRQ